MNRSETMLNQLPFPSDEVSRACANEKSVRHGHISTLQFWWARRPLAVCRSALFLLLCPLPSEISARPDLLRRLSAAVSEQHGLEQQLLTFAGKLAWWDACKDDQLLALARDILALGREQAPVVFDPFAGGGSIPVEALRLGLDAISGELSPVAQTALRVALRHAPELGPRLLSAYLEAVQTVGKRLEARVASLYEAEPHYTALAYFWCRIYTCPSCGCEAPLLRSKVLAKSPRQVVYRLCPPIGKGRFAFSIIENPTEQDLVRSSSGTVNARGATCSACQHVVTTTFLQAEGTAGKMGEQLFAVCEQGPLGRRYRTSHAAEEQHARSVKMEEITGRLLTTVPDHPFDKNGIRHIWAMQYGIDSTGDLYNHRQGVALLELFDVTREVIDEMDADASCSLELKQAVASLLSLTFNRVVMYSNRHVWWQATGEFPANIFVRQAISMVWDYVEMPINSVGAAGWGSAASWMRKAVEHLIRLPHPGQSILADAGHCPLADHSVDVVATDPPYFDSITYAYLADVFYVWMKPLLARYFPGDFEDALGPKREEAIVDRRHSEATGLKTAKHFRKKMGQAFREAHRVLRDDGHLLLMYGHKKAAAWEAVLGPLIEAGFEPVVSWPVHTERKVKFKHGKIEALSSSCLVLCKKRIVAAVLPRVTWSQFEKNLHEHLIGLVARYQAQHTSGPDLHAALLAPAVALFSRYEVIDSEGRRMSIADCFIRLPDIARACELQEALAGPSKATPINLSKAVNFLRECQRDRGNWLSLIGRSELLDSAIRYAVRLAEGDQQEADALMDGLSDDDRSGLCQILRLAAAMSEPDSRSERLARSSLGRLSMQARA